MANARLIDKINDEFIKILVQQKSKAYADYIKSINRELIQNIDNLDAKKARAIISKQSINIDDSLLLFTIQNAIILILEDRQKAKTNPNLLPIIALMTMYNVRKPKAFASRVLKVSSGRALNKRELQAFKLVESFKRDNAKVIASARKQSIKNMQQSIIKSKRNGKMLNDFKRLRKENKSIESIKNTLVRKYNKLSSVELALDTELHAQSEYVRQEHSSAMGYTHKTWKTQGDERVRKTCFHSAVSNKRIPINSSWKACGVEARYVGDERLPIGERARCRCYAIYD